MIEIENRLGGGSKRELHPVTWFKDHSGKVNGIEMLTAGEQVEVRIKGQKNYRLSEVSDISKQEGSVRQVVLTDQLSPNHKVHVTDNDLQTGQRIIRRSGRLENLFRPGRSSR